MFVIVLRGCAGTVQVVINPEDEPLWNLMTAMSNVDDLNLKQLTHKSDQVLPLIAAPVSATSDDGAPVGSSSDGAREPPSDAKS